jgi:DNA polymerase III delta subunit
MVTRAGGPGKPRGGSPAPRRGGSVSVREAETMLRGPAAGLPPLVLAAGIDDFLRERLARACRAGAEAEGSEFQRLEGDALDAETLAGALATLSLFGDARRIWIREGSKMGGAVEEALLAWADTPDEGTFVLVTTAHDVDDLKFLETLAARAVTVPCRARGGEGLEWAEIIAREEGVKLPGTTVEAIFRSAPDLLSFRQEIHKLASHADAEGRVPARALDSLREARAGTSVERWALAVLAGSAAEARAETEALAREGIGGTSALWALAECALGALEPQSFSYRRTPRATTPLEPATARAVLDQVYRADRALKRGEIRDTELALSLVQSVRRAIRG